MSSETNEKEQRETTIELCTIQHVYEKSNNIDTTPEKLSEPYEATQEDKIVKATRNDPYPSAQPYPYGQTPYYEQQRVGGHPVYVQVYISLEKETKSC